jgi:hypothetical protein
MKRFTSRFQPTALAIRPGRVPQRPGRHFVGFSGRNPAGHQLGNGNWNELVGEGREEQVLANRAGGSTVGVLPRLPPPTGSMPPVHRRKRGQAGCRSSLIPRLSS